MDRDCSEKLQSEYLASKPLKRVIKRKLMEHNWKHESFLTLLMCFGITFLVAGHRRH